MHVIIICKSPRICPFGLHRPQYIHYVHRRLESKQNVSTVYQSAAIRFRCMQAYPKLDIAADNFDRSHKF